VKIGEFLRHPFLLLPLARRAGFEVSSGGFARHPKGPNAPNLLSKVIIDLYRLSKYIKCVNCDGVISLFFDMGNFVNLNVTIKMVWYLLNTIRFG